MKTSSMKRASAASDARKPLSLGAVADNMMSGLTITECLKLADETEFVAREIRKRIGGLAGHIYRN